MFTSSDVRFWQTEGINYIHAPIGPEHYDGEENVIAAVGMVGNGTVRDVGCGYGRFARYFDSKKYSGYDICLAAVNKAKRLFPQYNFIHWDFSPLQQADTTLFVNGPHLVHPSEIEPLLKICCTDTEALVIGEMMDPLWVGKFECNEYRRSIDHYDDMLRPLGFIRTDILIGTHLTWQKPFTTAKWSRV
jgi:SAM-dependent methyltransferase